MFNITLGIKKTHLPNMRNLTLLILTISLISCQPSKKDLISSAVDKLNSLKTVQFKYNLELHYSDQNYFSKDSANCILDFTSKDTTLNLRFQFITSNNLMAYNGIDAIHLDFRKLMQIRYDNPRKKDVDFYYFTNSLYTAKNFLLKSLSDKSFIDSWIIKEEKDDQIVEFTLKGQRIDYWGNLYPIDTSIVLTYCIRFDKQSKLPKEFTQYNDSTRTSYIKATISSVKENIEIADSVWDLDRFTNKYRIVKTFEEDSIELIKIGKKAPLWTLPLIKGGQISLSSQKGKLVFIDFWHRHCGHCIKAIPELNRIFQKYKNRNIAMLSINFYDNKEFIVKFLTKNSIDFEVLYNGENIAKQYGVNYAPCIILIDKKGEVIYSGGFDNKMIEDILQKNI